MKNTDSGNQASINPPANQRINAFNDTNRIFNQPKCTINDSCDKKCVKPIIPKVKTSPPLTLTDDSLSASKKQSELIPKIQKPYHQQYQSRSHIKNFPKEQELEKMTKKQLAQTYYQQFLRLNRENQVLDKQLTFVRHERDVLYKRFNELKEEQNNSDDLRPKRQRRVATEILRNFNCPVANCDRSYGSQGSLIQHIKIKHQFFFGTHQYYTYLNKHSKFINRNDEQTKIFFLQTFKLQEISAV